MPKETKARGLKRLGYDLAIKQTPILQLDTRITIFLPIHAEVIQTDNGSALQELFLRKSPTIEDGDLAELEGYLCDKTDDLAGQGMGEEDAFKKAADEFAHADRLDGAFYRAQALRPGRRPPWQAPRFVPSLPWNYLKSALRHYKRQQAYSLLNIIGLALGLAAFSLGALTAYFGFHFDAFHKNADLIYGVVQILPSGVKD